MKKLLCLLKSLFKRVGQVFFVGAKDVLPEPLSKEEELKYLKEMEEGSVEAKNKLIEHKLQVLYFSLSYKYLFHLLILWFQYLLNLLNQF